MWHDFAPDGATLQAAGPWFPLLVLYNAATGLSGHSVHRPRAVKSAGKINKAPAAASASADVADSTGTAVGSADEFVPPPQKKARHKEGGSK